LNKRIKIKNRFITNNVSRNFPRSANSNILVWELDIGTLFCGTFIRILLYAFGNLRVSVVAIQCDVAALSGIEMDHLQQWRKHIGNVADNGGMVVFTVQIVVPGGGC
jgi:hypothetical protein